MNTLKAIFCSALFYVAATSVLHAGVSFHVSGLPEALSSKDIPSVLEKFIEESPEKDIMFYVHGRGRTLDEELRRSREIEHVHNIKVLMLHWDSWSSTISRPTDNAENTGDDLREAVAEIARFKGEHEDVFKTKRIFILFHSMGNLILKSYAENYPDENLKKEIFDAAILSAADAPYRNHKDWLSEVNISKHQFVLMNKNDAVLNASKLLDMKRENFFDDRMGLGIRYLNHSNKIISPNVLYFDITRASGIKHVHFVSKNREVKKIFQYILSRKSSDKKESPSFLKRVFTGETKSSSFSDEAKPEEALAPFRVIKNVYYFKD